MRLNEIKFPDGTPVEGYGPGFFRVGAQIIRGGVLVMPNSVQRWDGYSDTDVLLAEAAAIDVLLLGTGAEIAHAPADLRAALEEAQVGIEVMASPAACRTYNVLLSEGRRIGLAALPVP